MGASDSRRAAEIRPQAVMSSELPEPWRAFNWGQRAALIQRLEEFRVSHPHVRCIKILIVGPVGAGKSSFINSVNSALQGRISSAALADSTAGYSFTHRLTTHRVRTANSVLPFAFCDMMGLEAEAMAGSQPDDIINTIFGHVKDGYKFNCRSPVSQHSKYYSQNPDLGDQVFCVVFIIATDKDMDEKLVEKIRIVRKIISEKGIPQIIVMTRVDEACPLVRQDLKKIYTSKKIKHKMDLCSDKVGVPLSYIFPVKNYHEEIDTDENVDVLILKAIEQIVHAANNRLMDQPVT